MTTLQAPAVMPQTENPAELRELYLAVQMQRVADVERMRAAVREREQLKATIAELEETNMSLREQVTNLEQARSTAVVLRLTRPGREKHNSLLTKIMGAVTLKFARYHARSNRFPEAEALYQAVAVFKPRPFLIKQVATMLYHQQLYKGALELLLEIEEAFEGDKDVAFLVGACEAALD